MPLSFGDKLGPYEILAPIGAGGMGEVYRAHDSRLNRDVAIKVSAAQFSERFEREAKAIAALNHSNICQVYDVGPNYLVMELIEGTALKGPLALDQALRYAAQICDALDAAHKKNITHRDLKPANILVTASGVKLLDFGLAKISLASASDGATETMALTEAGTVMGTPAYMSPEQAKGEEVDARSDIFSFGVVLYEMLSGRRAFARNSSVETMSAILHDEPAALDAPSHVSEIVMRCLRKSRSDRFQTITEIRKALEQISAKPGAQQPSIAVLPFADMSPGKDNEYFSDGLAEEVINALAQVPDLKVIARTSAFAFKGQNTDVRRIAEALGVTSILEGSVRKAGNRIRVTAQLIAAGDGSHLWSQRYDRELEDVFAVQDEIAAAIAGALQVKLAVSPRGHTPTVAAYEAFMQGRHHWAKLTPESLERSRECYERAVALDPQFAAARCSLAEHFFALAANCLMPAHEAMSQVRAGALRALEIDPSLPDAHALLGLVAVYYDHDWTETARRFRSAMAQVPVPPRIRWTYGHCLSVTGRNREAIEELGLALQDDPLHLLCRCHLAACLHAAGQHAEAVRQVSQVLEIDDRFGIAHFYAAIFQMLEGRVAEALASTEKAYRLMPWNRMAAGLLAGLLSRTGETTHAESLLSRLRPAESYGAPMGWVAYHLARQEPGAAAEWVERGIAQRDTGVTELLPYMRTSSRWPELAKMMNLTEGTS